MCRGNKSETRRPKSEVDPKTECRKPKPGDSGALALLDTGGEVLKDGNDGNDGNHGFRNLPFGFPSPLFRISDFGIRIYITDWPPTSSE
jgi:hypothetical protein